MQLCQRHDLHPRQRHGPIIGRRWGNSGWSFRDCLPYFLRAENWNGPRSPIHGHDGPLHTSRYGVHHPLSKAFVEAGVQAGYPYRDDFNGGEQEGFGPCDSTIKAVEDKGIRASTAFAYLHPVKERKNLRIITKALATRVIVERGRAVGVEFLRRGRKKCSARIRRCCCRAARSTRRSCFSCPALAIRRICARWASRSRRRCRAWARTCTITCPWACNAARRCRTRS